MEAILRVERPQPDHLYWPDLDVDLSVNSLRTEEAYAAWIRRQISILVRDCENAKERRTMLPVPRDAATT